MLIFSLLTNFSLFCLILCETDYYKLLGVSPSATSNQIKKAYRKLAKDLHPDKNPSPDADNEFRKVTEAFKVLRDDEKRAIYDKYGHEGLKNDMDADSSFDPFSAFFGGMDDFGFGFGSSNKRANKQATNRGADVRMDLFVSLEEVYQGNFVEVERMVPYYRESSGSRRCKCRQEMVTRSLGPGRFAMTQQEVCEQCPNMQLDVKKRNIDIEIEVGVVDGHELKFEALGEPHIDGEPGDLVFVVRSLTHPVFERRGDDLYTNVTISLAEALVGFELNITHLDGHAVHVKRERVTWSGARIRKKGEGMPNYVNNMQTGTLYITVDIEFPKRQFTDEEKTSIMSLLNQTSEHNVYNGISGR